MINKVIEYQIRNNITQNELCTEIGIGIKTMYNVRKGECSDSTMKKIENFVTKKGL